MTVAPGTPTGADIAVRMRVLKISSSPTATTNEDEDAEATMPMVGFGTAHLYEADVLQALRCGARHLDC